MKPDEEQLSVLHPCDDCGAEISEVAYQVRIGYMDDDDFQAGEDVGYYCGSCITNGIK